MLCDDFIESFMRGNFSRVARTLEKLDHVKTQNIRQLLTRQESELQQTIETDFNERFRNEAAGSSALFGEED
jgi:hypothetical protein